MATGPPPGEVRRAGGPPAAPPKVRPAAPPPEARRLPDEDLIRRFLEQVDRYGCPILPLRPGEKVVAAPAGWNDHGAVEIYEYFLSPDEALDRLRRGGNIGVRAGGRVVLFDCDTEAKARRLLALLDGVPACIVRTPRMIHVYCVWPEDEPLPRSTTAARCRELRGIEIKTARPAEHNEGQRESGGYQVAVGSRIDASVYERDGKDVPATLVYRIRRREAAPLGYPTPALLQAAARAHEGAPFTARSDAGGTGLGETGLHPALVRAIWIEQQERGFRREERDAFLARAREIHHGLATDMGRDTKPRPGRSNGQWTGRWRSTIRRPRRHTVRATGGPDCRRSGHTPTTRTGSPIAPAARRPPEPPADLPPGAPPDAEEESSPPPPVPPPSAEDADGIPPDPDDDGDERRSFILRAAVRMIRLGIREAEVQRGARHLNGQVMRPTDRRPHPLPPETVERLVRWAERQHAERAEGNGAAPVRRGVLFARDETRLITAAHRLEAWHPDPADFRFNERLEMIERRKPGGGPEVWEGLDDFSASLRGDIHRWTWTLPEAGRRRKAGPKDEQASDSDGNPLYGAQPLRGLARFDSARDYLASAVEERARANPLDPLAEWFRSLPDCDPKAGYIARLLPDMFAVAESDREIAAQGMRSTMIGVVRRALRPGCQHDAVLVLLGRGGSGKDTLWRRLLPVLPGCDLYTGSFAWDAPYERQVQITIGKAIVHASDSPGLRRADRERVKTYLSEVVDRCRLPYRRDAQDFPRRHILVASVNDPRFIPIDSVDDGRRWIPVPVERKYADGERCRQGIIDTLEAPADDYPSMRVAAWAEAYAAATSGEWGKLTGGAEDRRQSLLAVHRAREHQEDEIEDFLGVLGSPRMLEWSDTRPGTTTAGGSHAVQDGMRLSEIGHAAERSGLAAPKRGWEATLPRPLKNAGWEPRQVRRWGNRGRFWFPPKPADSPSGSPDSGDDPGF